MPVVVAENQTSFEGGRHITDSVVVAQEVVHSMRLKQGKKCWMAVKIDMEKEYDRLRWDFIENTLLDVNLPSSTVRLIMRCVSTSVMQVLWNGGFIEEFKPFRGIRQGDPMSPYLFVLTTEILGHAIERAISNGSWTPIMLGQNGPPLSHIFFADDFVLFREADLVTVETLSRILADFCGQWGHKVSLSKSKICFSSNTEVGLKGKISRMLGFQQTENLGVYLGYPLFHTRTKNYTFQFVADKVQNKLNGYNAELLLLAGRIILAKSVLMSIPGYFMQVMMLPIGVYEQIGKIVRHFVWGASNEVNKTALVNWETCQSLMQGGNGIRRLSTQNMAFMMKLAFHIVTKVDALWVRVLRAKYKVF